MAVAGRRVRAVFTAVILTVVAIAAIALGTAFASGLGLTDAAGRPLDVPSVSIVPSEPTSAEATPALPPRPADNDRPEVVTAPPPVTVELDDHGGDRNVDGSNDNSGRGNSNED